jgi:N-acetylglucosaminyl-diphospho-decaprenol L-rhamnosyltransferase
MIEPAPAAPPLREVAPVPLLSIVIVTWNSERWIGRCLESIPAACEGLNYEIVVYDNASSDATLTRVGDAPRQVLRSTSNDGYAAATNRAIRECRGKYLFLLNPDCELAPRAVSMLADFLDKHPSAAAAAPLLEDEEGASQREFQLRRLPSIRTFMSEIFGLGRLMPRNGATSHYRYRDLDDLTRPQRIEQLAGAALLIRRDVVDEIGPFDERFGPAWFEDVDYCHRLADAGKELWVIPNAAARHFGGASLEYLTFRRFHEIWYRNMWLYARKWMPKGEAEALRWMIIAGMALRVVAALAGVAHPEVGRLRAARAYAHVLEKAFKRWSDSSRSFS